ncbi:MAG: transglycosylase domain-containing protein [Eubacteriales bacterium]|nr:transglycosylase domain-containing protein [Eubacteriales bacterium]
MSQSSSKQPRNKNSKQRKKLLNRIRPKPSSDSSRPSFIRFVGMTLGQAFKIVFVLILIAGIAFVGLGSGMLSGYISTAQAVEIGNIQSNLTREETRILDKDGQLITTLKSAGSNTEFVSYNEIKGSYIDDAFIAIEDERFYSHPGIDMRRIFSAVLSAVMNGGNPTHGGSTITQQTIKMITGKDDISAQRKIQEWYSAVELEKSMSKEAIMELYLNLVPMANNYQGVQAASKAYFNKNVKDLSLAECALLAGIPNRPATYNPMTEYGRRNCLRRMRLVLGTMLENGFIKLEDYDKALNQEIVFDFSMQDRGEENILNWFVEATLKEVQEDLINKRGYTPELAAMAVYNYGLTIETTMDSEAQAKLERVFQDESLFITNPAVLPNTPEHPQAAITVMDNLPGNEGLIRALVGGYGKKKSNLIFNLATDAKRQPGSSIKPLVVYTPALEVGAISQASYLMDEPKYLNPNDPTKPYPLNYSRTYEGEVTLERALLMSLNTIAADIYANRLGPEVGLAYLKDCGIDRTDETYVATALGGFETGMSTWEMTEAYSVLANQGVYHEPTTYLRVLNQDGTVLLDNSQRESYQVYNPATTYVMTSMLKPIAEAPWNDAKPTNTIAAGKTGTTEFFRDVWFCGYTPYYTAAVWYGYANANGRNISIPIEDGFNACHIWRESMQALHENLTPADFARPDGVINMTICSETHDIANEFCPETRNVLLIEGSPANPDKVCEEHNSKNRKKGNRDEDEEEGPIYAPTAPQPEEDDEGFNQD